jgi:hypothetical protein
LIESFFDLKTSEFVNDFENHEHSGMHNFLPKIVSFVLPAALDRANYSVFLLLCSLLAGSIKRMLQLAVGSLRWFFL